MTNRKFTEEFRKEAVIQIKEHGYKVSTVRDVLSILRRNLFTSYAE